MPNGSSLAVFSRNWLGGDIHGLMEVAEKLEAYLPRVQDLVGRLSATASGLTAAGRGGWQGAAADGFTAAWRAQAATAVALEEYVAGVARAVGSLAVELSQLESALEYQAHQVSQQGVVIGPDGSVESYGGPGGLELAMEYDRVREQARAEADQVRSAAAQQLYGLYQQVIHPGPHLNGVDANTGAGLLADLLATPTAARREVRAEVKKLQGKDLNFEEEIAEARRTGKLLPQETFDKSAKVGKALEEVKEELAQTGKTESALSRLLDTRASDAENYLQGKAGSGRHVAGNTPEDLKAAAAADEGPKFLKQVLKLGNEIPLIDVGTTLVGTAVGTYYDVKGGQSLGSAVRDEALSNAAGTAAATGTAAAVGAVWGGELGAAGGPIGIGAGVVIGYGVGDATHNMLTENWGQDTHRYGEVLGRVYGVGHVEIETGKDFGKLGVGVGHEAEHLWDGVFD